MAGVAGFLGLKEDWIEFERDWQAVLNEYKRPWFHNKEFSNRFRRTDKDTLPFQGMSAEEGERFQIDLSRVASRHALLGRGGFLYVSAYDALVPDWYKKIVGSPYGLCVRLFLETMLTEINSYCLQHLEHTRAAFVFDQSKADAAWQHLVIDSYRGVKDHRDTLDHMGPQKFDDMKKVAALQAADLLASRLRRVSKNVFGAHEAVPINAIDNALARNVKILCYDENYLRNLALDLERDRHLYEYGLKGVE